MFKIPQEKKSKNDLPSIEGNKVILHFDEVPILYSGTNKYGNRIIGSFVAEDYQEKFERFFHTLISENIYSDFLNQKITYLELLKNSKNIFVLDKSFDNAKEEIYFIDFDEIPSEYLPTERSICPELQYVPSVEYSFSLKGKMADVFSAIPDEVGDLLEYAANLLKSSFEHLKILNFDPRVLTTPSTLGSYKLNFKIDFENKQATLFEQQNKEILTKFVHNYMNFCLNKLPRQAENIFSNEEKSTEFMTLIENFQEVQGLTKQKDIDIEELLIVKLKKSANQIEDLTENIGIHFNSIEITNKYDNVDNLVGVIDSSYREEFEKAIEVIEMKTSRIEVDDEPKTYKILVYHLNTESRRGNAYVENESNKEELSKPKIFISGDEPLENSAYTKSLHINTWIEVKGKAKKIDNKIRSIEIVGV